MRRACAALSGIDRWIFDEQASAELRWQELERHPWPRRFVLVEHLERFRSLGLADRLLIRSRSAWAADANESERYAQLSLVILDRLLVAPVYQALIRDHQARAWAYVANARRIRAEFRPAEVAFDRAEVFLQTGTGDATELAQFLDLRASLARETHQWPQAERLLRQVIAIHCELGDEHLEGRGLLSLGLLRSALGEPAEALECIERAAALIDGDRDPRLRFAVEKNRALYLSALGRTDEARARLPMVRRLARALGTRLDHLRLLWVSALIHRDGGRHELAELALRRVRDGFLEENLPFDAALAALDLAALYLKQGRLAATAELARDTATVFSLLAVQPQLLTALGLFHQAAERQQATVAWIQDLAREVHRQSFSRS